MEAGKVVAGAREGVLARHGVIMESASSTKEAGEQVSFFILFHRLYNLRINLSNIIYHSTGRPRSSLPPSLPSVQGEAVNAPPEYAG